MTRVVQLLSVLAVIAVPAAGWFVGDWSGGTTLAVYWFETIAASLFIAGRIVVHQRWTPRRGHFKYEAPTATRRGSRSSSFVTGFLVTSLVFCAAHGLFLALILFMLDRNGDAGLAEIDWRSVGFGCVSVVGFLAIDFLMDLLSLRRWSFWQIEQTANQGLSRVVVVHLTLILGLFCIAITGAPNALFGVFVVLKTLASLSTALPQWEPATAPQWLSSVMNRLPNAHRGRRFEEVWAEDRADEIERRARNDKPWADARR
ncbi:DUF6498-containing protein [soil metagenome]